MTLLMLAQVSLFSMPAFCSEELTARQIMDEVYRRHMLFPYVFEEQTMILIDKSENYNVRMARRFSRMESDRTAKFLLVLDNPAEVRGVALLAVLGASGQTESVLYMPAFENKVKSVTGNSRSGLLLGTDLSIEDIASENLSDFRYTRAPDSRMDDTDFFVIDAVPINKDIKAESAYSRRRHFIRQDIYFIFRTEFYDQRNRLFKTLTHHDLKRVDGDMWRASMLLMENHKKKHKTLIKITDRIFSRDYVPEEIFTTDWLLENKHISETKDRLLEKTSGSFSGKEREFLKNNGTGNHNNWKNNSD